MEGDSREPAERHAPAPVDRSAVLARITPEQLVDILDVAEDGIVCVDARQRIVAFNRGARKLFGYAPEEVIGLPLDALVPERFRAAHPAQVEAFARAPVPARLMAERRAVFGRRKDGSEFPAEISITKSGAGPTALFTAIVRDVTERQRLEAAHRELDRLRSQARLDAVLNSAQDAIVLLGADRTVALFNPAAERAFGCPAASALGAPVERFLPAGLPPVGPAPVEVNGRRADGTAVPLEVASSRAEAGGQVTHALILRDVTERKATELRLREAAAERERALAELRATTQQLWQAAKLAGVGELAASIAHELNNPLGTVSLRVEGVLAKTPADDPRRKPLEIVSQEVDRMAGLVANLLQFSRAGRDQVSTVDVCDEVTRTLDLIAHHLRKHQVRVAPEFAPGVPNIQADRQHLRQVLLNLFTNAVDAMPEGGRLTPRVALGRTPDGAPAVVIEVSDTGVGIPGELLDRVCEPFFTTKEEGKGTGLGLAICRRIVEQHRGTLEVRSAAGAGTTIRITLPLRPDTNVAGLR